MREFCDKIKEPPADLNEMYVVKYEMSEDPAEFKVFFSTKRLLMYATYTENIHTVQLL